METIDEVQSKNLPQGWQLSTIKGVCHRALNGGTPSTKNARFWHGVIPWITGADIVDNKITNIRRYISEEAVENSATNVIPAGNLLIVSRTGVGKVAVNFFDIAISQDITGFIPNEKTFSGYLYRVLCLLEESLKKSTQGTSINGITRDKLMELPFPLPPLSEQRKIAAILSYVDDAIILSDEIIGKTEYLKYGLMHELLNGIIRFPDFNDIWQIKAIENITECIAGGTPSTEIQSYWGGNILWMCSGELNLKFVYDVAGRITDEGLNNSSTKRIPPKCVLIGLAGQGKTRGTVAINFVELCTNQSIAAILPNSRFFPEYLYYNLDSRYTELRNLSAGDGGRGGLNLSIIKSIKLFLPSLGEQQKIAAILSSVDDRLTVEREYRSKLLELKKGLMQVLLTGQVRVKTDTAEVAEGG